MHNGMIHKKGTLATSRQSRLVTPISNTTAHAGNRTQSATRSARTNSVVGLNELSLRSTDVRVAHQAQQQTETPAAAMPQDQTLDVIDRDIRGSTRNG